jgi:hypothetical protein
MSGYGRWARCIIGEFSIVSISDFSALVTDIQIELKLEFAKVHELKPSHVPSIPSLEF